MPVRYDRFMRKDRAAYDEMYVLIRPVVKAKTVLELATGTGLIAKHIVNAAAHIEATDASAEMIAEASGTITRRSCTFPCRICSACPYADESFDVVIVSNALHIVPQPEKALAEIRRVLKDDGVLIAPTFTHAGELVFRQGQSLFHEARRIPSPQQVDERGIPALSKSEWLDGAEKRCSEGVLPADLCGMCEIGGVIRCHFLRTPESLWGLAGKSWSL